MPARSITGTTRATSRWRVVIALAAAIPFISAARLSATPATDIYATFETYAEGAGYGYGFGTFDLGNPSGSVGSYSYTWTMLLSPTSATLDNVALNPNTGAMALQYEFNEFRSITTSGVLSGSLGPTPTFWGMTFDASGGLYAWTGYGGPQWLRLDPADGQTLASGTASGEITDIYAAGGGRLAPRPGGGFVMANQYPGQELVRLTPAGNDVTTVITGTFAGAGFDPENQGLVLFTSGTSLYLLQASNLFAVDESTAALTKLGTVDGLPVSFTGFSGAAGTITAVPEPATWCIVLAGLAGGGWMLRRRRPSPDGCL